MSNNEDIKIKLKKKKLHLIGFSFWKRKTMSEILKNFDYKSLNFSSEKKIKKNITNFNKNEDVIICWSMIFEDINTIAADIPIFRMEDGFIRSKNLGSDLTKPLSLVLDSKGIYFNPKTETDLENMINSSDFTKNQLDMSNLLLKKIFNNKISKYNSQDHIDYSTFLNKNHNQKIKLVIGQVEDDASIKYGSNSITDNLSLLKKVFENKSKNDYIIFKPHPDVSSGNRLGSVNEEIALHYCDKIEEEYSLVSLLNIPEIEVHTISSLSGFENLLRGNKTVCYGNPFYSGWGLTEDLYMPEYIKNRRHKKVSILELLYNVYIKYPMYFDIHTNKLTDVFKTIDIIQKQKPKKINFLLKLRRKIIYFFKNLRNNN